MNEYSVSYEIRPSDIDVNGHVNYAVYIDAAGDLRYRFFSKHGFPPERYREARHRANLHRHPRPILAGSTHGRNDNHHLFPVRPFTAGNRAGRCTMISSKPTEKKAVSLDLEGAILDLAARKPVPPTTELLQTFNLVPRATDFGILSERWTK